MVEKERGCGWRKIGGTYLTADEGMHVDCDALPLELKPCDCCEYEIHQARSLVPYHAGYLASLLHGHKCKDKFPCPLCYFANQYHGDKDELRRIKLWNSQHPNPKEQKPLIQVPENFFVMWVSKQFYTPQSFVKEAQTQGISKRIAANSLPVDFVVGRDWVFLAHGEVPFAKFTEGFGEAVVAPDGDVCEGPKPVTVIHKPAIFYAFKPKRLELVLYKGTPDDVIRKYEDAGYYVVLLEKTPENLERHGDGEGPPLPTGKGKAVRKLPSKTKKPKADKPQDEQTEDKPKSSFAAGEL